MKESEWLPGSCFLPGTATPSGGVAGRGERLQSLSQSGRDGGREEGREGGREGGRGTGEEESGVMPYHSLTSELAEVRNECFLNTRGSRGGGEGEESKEEETNKLNSGFDHLFQVIQHL